MQGNPQSRAIINALQNNLNPVAEVVYGSSSTVTNLRAIIDANVNEAFKDKISYAVIVFTAVNSTSKYSLAFSSSPSIPFTTVGETVILANTEQINKFSCAINGTIVITLYTNISF